MEREELKSTLSQLHQQLQSGAGIDPEIEQLVLQLAADLDRWADPAATEAGLSAPREIPAERQSVLDRLAGLTDEFAETHPQLAEAIGRVASALSRIGI